MKKWASIDIATKYLFKRVTIGGHGELYNEKKDFDKAYYRIDDLNNNSLLDRLDLDFYQINNYSYSTDRDGYVTALNTNLCDIAHKLKIMVIPTPAVRPAKPDLLEQYQIELEQLASNDCEAIRQKNIQLDIDLTTANEEIADLKSQPAQAQPKNTPADDVTLATRSQNLAAKIILALIDIAELNRDSQPYQYDELNSNNRLIYDQIKANGMNVSQQKIGHWLDLAIRQVKDK